MEQTTAKNGYSSINELLMKKFGHTDISKMDFPDLRHKTVFVDKKGNEINGVLSYEEAEKIVEAFIHMPLP